MRPYRCILRSQADDDPKSGERQRGANEHPAQLALLGAERESNTDLARARASDIA
jgi:hypothetical protein